MSTLFRRRFLRTTAWTMLLVWLLALSAGVANACLLAESRAHGHAPMSGAMVADASTLAAGHRVVRAADVDHGEHQALEASCLKVCDETPQSPVKQASSLDFDRPGLAEGPRNSWRLPAMLARRAIPSAATALVIETGPPVRVIYSRLVL